MRYITKGNYKSFTIQLVDCKGNEIDLSDKTIRLMIKKDKEALDTTAIYDNSIVNPSANIIVFELSSDITDNFDIGNYYIGCKVYETVGAIVKNREVWFDDLEVVSGLFKS